MDASTWVAFLLTALVIVGSDGATGRMLLLGSVFAAPTLVVSAAYGAAAGVLRARVIARPRLVERIRAAFAASFAVPAGRLAVETR